LVFGGLILFLVVGNNLVPAPILAFAGALSYFISWWLIGWRFFQSKTDCWELFAMI